MRKWILLLSFALLFNVARSYAEEIFYTNNQDPYYHTDSACNIPPDITWSGTEYTYYPREAYNTVTISAEAAAAFEKIACPVCVEKFEAVYLGDHFPEWPLDVNPWGIGDIDPETKMHLMKARPQAYTDEIAATDSAFETYFEEYYDRETDSSLMYHAYPDWYGGRWANNATGKTYAIVSPTQEILSEFKALFGGGAWILPAKYSWNQLRSAQDEFFNALRKWCDNHPEAGAQVVSAYSGDVENGVFIGIYGTGWQNAAATMDEIAPVYVHFFEETSLPTTDF